MDCEQPMDCEPPSYNSVTQHFLNELIGDVRPKKNALNLRKIKKEKERSSLEFKIKQQKDKLRKMVLETRTTESQLQAVNTELQQIERDLSISVDTDAIT